VPSAREAAGGLGSVGFFFRARAHGVSVRYGGLAQRWAYDDRRRDAAVIFSFPLALSVSFTFKPY